MPCLPPRGHYIDRCISYGDPLARASRAPGAPLRRSFKGPLFLNTLPAPSNSCLLLSRIILRTNLLNKSPTQKGGNGKLILEIYEGVKMYNLYFLSAVFIIKCNKNLSCQEVHFSTTICSRVRIRQLFGVFFVCG